MKYTLHIVDVFSSTPFGGDQLAILPDAAGISSERMQKIARGFNFGEAMALTLVKAGTRLLVWNRTRAKAESLAAAGAEVARDAADVFSHSATVFLMPVDGGAIDTVLDRGGTAFAARVTGRTVVHMGASSPAYSRELETDIRSVGGY